VYYRGQVDRHSFPTRRSSDLEQTHFPCHRPYVFEHAPRRLVARRKYVETHVDHEKILIGHESCRSYGFYQRPIQENAKQRRIPRSEEHTSELQSRENLVCRLL